MAMPTTNSSSPNTPGPIHSPPIPTAPIAIPTASSTLLRNLSVVTPSTNRSGMPRKNIAATQRVASLSDTPRPSIMGKICTSIPLVADTRMMAPTIISQ